MGIVWELDGKSSPPYPFKKDKKHPLGACWCHPIGAHQVLYLKVFFEGTSYLDRCFPSMELFFLTDCGRGQGEKI
jgi:hypothetical protein